MSATDTCVRCGRQGHNSSGCRNWPAEDGWSPILAIDPGTERSGWCLYAAHGRRVISSGVSANLDVLRMLEDLREWPLRVAIERFEARGMPIGDDSILTIIWSGRFAQAAGDRVEWVKRSAVKSALCGTQRAKDANVRAALIDRLGQPGTKRQPGPTHGVSSHAWAALAVAVTASEAAA